MPRQNEPIDVEENQAVDVRLGLEVIHQGAVNEASASGRLLRNILGAVLPTYVLPSAQTSDNGAGFSVLVSNAFGQTSSGAAETGSSASGAARGRAVYTHHGCFWSGKIRCL